MKNATATALAPLITGCAQQTFTVQNKPKAVAPAVKPSTNIFCSLELAEENCRCAKICGGAENVIVKQKPSKHS